VAEEQQAFVLKILLGLTSVITIAALAANLGLFGHSEILAGFAKWGLAGGLGVNIPAKVGISKGLFTRAHRLRVSVDFPSREPGDVTLDADQCEYQLLDEDGKEIKRDKIIPVREGLSWECTLPPKALESFYIKLYLAERGGRQAKMVVGPFYSFKTIQKAEVIS